MTLEERIEGYLLANPGTLVCETCLAAVVGAASGRVTGTIAQLAGTSRIRTDHGRCLRCRGVARLIGIADHEDRTRR